MVLILASTTLLTARIAAGCLVVTLIIVLFVAKNVSKRSLRSPNWIYLFHMPLTVRTCVPIFVEYGIRYQSKISANCEFQVVIYDSFFFKLLMTWLFFFFESRF